VLLVVLWARSYWLWDWYNSSTVARHNVTIGSTQGWLGIVIRIGTLPGVPPRTISLSSVPVGELPTADGQWELNTFNYPWGGWECSMTIPHWFLVVSTSMIAVAPWLRWRFTLCTLLIATTLVAVILGLVVYATRGN
jgi:hypothetical protein